MIVCGVWLGEGYVVMSMVLCGVLLVLSSFYSGVFCCWVVMFYRVMLIRLMVCLMSLI